ncbi:unnamed protein product [Colias eurytheme]|nr:unnamed protein product [Colias eurytheme]
MLADGEIVGDGSWNLTIYVTDMNEKRTMVVKGDMHIGGVMLKLTESFGSRMTTAVTHDTDRFCSTINDVTLRIGKRIQKKVIGLGTFERICSM